MNSDEQFTREVEEAKKVLSLEMISRMSLNDMPECFEFQRTTGVALAQLLVGALQQNQIMIEHAQRRKAVAWRYRYSTRPWRYVDREEDCNPGEGYEREALYTT